MSVTMAVLGAGMQGTAAGYDFARFGADSVRMLDVDIDRAKTSAARINALTGRAVATGMRVDARDGAAVTEVLRGAKVALSCVPYGYNEGLARAAMAAGVSLGDLGGNTEVVWRELALDAEARRAGVSIVPDLGLAPGLGNTLAVHAMSKVEKPRHVQVRCGGLPQQPRPPLEYKLVFSVEGLTNEYFGRATVLRDGKRVDVDTFDELESLSFDGLGELEAFTTSGGSSTCPWTYEGTLVSWDYKTVRYPGHHAKMKVLKDMGFLDLAPVTVAGRAVVPRDVFNVLAARCLDFPDDPDVVVLRATCVGERGTSVLEVTDRQDPVTGFSAMERMTAFPAAVVCWMMARGEVPQGATRLESSVNPSRMIEELSRRGVLVTERAG